MCRKEKIWALMLFSLGIGLFIAGFIGSPIFRFLFGIIFVIIGVCLINRKP